MVCTRRCGQGGKDEVLGGLGERGGRHGGDQIGGVVVFGLHHHHHQAAGGRLTPRVVRLRGWCRSREGPQRAGGGTQSRLGEGQKNRGRSGCSILTHCRESRWTRAGHATDDRKDGQAEEAG